MSRLWAVFVASAVLITFMSYFFLAVGDPTFVSFFFLAVGDPTFVSLCLSVLVVSARSHSCVKWASYSMMDLQLSKQQVVSQYDKLARSRRFPDNTLLHKTLLKLILSDLASEPMEILDADSGAGFFGVKFAALGHRVTLTDFSSEALAFAQERSEDRKCRERIVAINGDVEHLPFHDESFDVVVCIFVFSHLNDPGGAVVELRRVLRRGGRLIISFENKLWHVIAAGLREKYGEAMSLLSSKNPIVKAYDILPPIRLYSVSEVQELCCDHGLQNISFTGVRHLTSFQEPLKGIGTTDTEYLLRDDPEAQGVENLLTDTRELLCLARHFLVSCEREG